MVKNLQKSFKESFLAIISLNVTSVSQIITNKIIFNSHFALIIFLCDIPVDIQLVAFLLFKVHSLVVSDLHSEMKGFWFESGC